MRPARPEGGVLIRNLISEKAMWLDFFPFSLVSFSLCLSDFQVVNSVLIFSIIFHNVPTPFSLLT